MRTIMIAIATGALLIFFQNCQSSSFTGAETTASKLEGDVVPVATEDGQDANGEITQPADPNLQPPDMGQNDPINPEDPVTPEDPNSEYPVPPMAEPPSAGRGNNGNGQGPGGVKNMDPSATGNVCILDGPGKSVKLGIASGTPAGQNAIPKVLCMTANACLNIASQYFTVKGPEFRGYCKVPRGNPHVVHISDAELQVKIDALKAAAQNP